MSSKGYYTAFGEYKTTANNIVEHMTDDGVHQEHSDDDHHHDNIECPDGYVCIPNDLFNEMKTYEMPINEEHIDDGEEEYLRNMTEAAAEAAATEEQTNEQKNEELNKFDCNRCDKLNDGNLDDDEMNYLKTECNEKCS